MEKKKALIVATVAAFIASFEIDDIQRLQSLGYEVHVATNYNEIKESPKKDLLDAQQIIRHNVSFTRKPLSKANINAYKELKKIIKKQNFEIIHCHTPVGGAITRLVLHRKSKRINTRVIYTAHGLHFYKGAPKKNWLFFFPIEWLLSWKTDIFIAINKEDYSFANRHLHAKKTVFLPGIGIDTVKFEEKITEKNNIRKTLNIDDKTIAMLSVGELCSRKNHIEIIDALSKINSSNIHLYIAGAGNLENTLQTRIHELGLEDKISLLGYRTDIVELCTAADVFILPSFQEGLPVALMEAIASKTPVFCSRIRGSVDLLTDDSFAFSPFDSDELAMLITRKIGNDRNKFLIDSNEVVKKNFDNLLPYKKSNVNRIMMDVYRGDIESIKI